MSNEGETASFRAVGTPAPLNDAPEISHAPSEDSPERDASGDDWVGRGSHRDEENGH